MFGGKKHVWEKFGGGCRTSKLVLSETKLIRAVNSKGVQIGAEGGEGFIPVAGMGGPEERPDLGLLQSKFFWVLGVCGTFWRARISIWQGAGVPVDRFPHPVRRSPSCSLYTAVVAALPGRVSLGFVLFCWSAKVILVQLAVL
jgi:hypothetical protein